MQINIQPEKVVLFCAKLPMNRPVLCLKQGDVVYRVDGANWHKIWSGELVCDIDISPDGSLTCIHGINFSALFKDNVLIRRIKIKNKNRFFGSSAFIREGALLWFTEFASQTMLCLFDMEKSKVLSKFVISSDEKICTLCPSAEGSYVAVNGYGSDGVWSKICDLSGTIVRTYIGCRVFYFDVGTGIYMSHLAFDASRIFIEKGGSVHELDVDTDLSGVLFCNVRKIDQRLFVVFVYGRGLFLLDIDSLTFVDLCISKGDGSEKIALFNKEQLFMLSGRSGSIEYISDIRAPLRRI